MSNVERSDILILGGGQAGEGCRSHGRLARHRINKYLLRSGPDHYTPVTSDSIRLSGGFLETLTERR